MEAFQSELTSALLQDLLQRLSSLTLNEIGQSVLYDAEQEVKKLERKLLQAQALFDSFQLATNNASQHWVGDLTRVCYDCEDLIDDIMVGSCGSSVHEKILAFFTRGSMTRKIQELEGRLDDIISGLNMVVKAKQHSRQCLLPTEERICWKQQIVLPENMIGREQDKESIIKMLLNDRIGAVSIVGINGLGKTTLAFHVQCDTRIQAHFDHIVKVSVCAKFDFNTVARAILHPRKEMDYNFPADQIQGLFHDLYVGKTILIVLDDVRDVRYDDWSLFDTLFLRSSGCKVLITTCNPKVSMVSKASPYYLPRMPDEECQALIIVRALYGNNLSDLGRINLEEAAEAISIKCKGLPLAANIVGLHLSSWSPGNGWAALAEKEIYDLPVFREEIFPAFKLNDPHLASHLKKCLAFCSLFPHDYTLRRDNLVQLWMAEGFVLPQGGTNLEEIGSDYFDDLLGRSILQFSHYDDERIPTYKMHEFIHRYAEFLASDTCFRLEEGNSSSSSTSWYKKARHLSLLFHSIQSLKFIEKCEGLRTFLLLSECGRQIGQIPYSLFQKLLRLRVLDLSDTDAEEFPESMGRLKHLQYLDLSRTSILKLPESTSELTELRILKLRDCFQLLELPKNTKNLINLQHLDVDIKGLKCMPDSIGNLSHLQTLQGFIVGKKEGKRISELKNLKFLRTSICLSELDNVRDRVEANEAMICDKPFIKRLELEWSRYPRDRSTAMEVLAGLEPHKNLEELIITNYSGSRFPEWLTSTSCRLVSIHLQNCRQHNVLPSLGQLRYLKTLHIEGMHDVESIDYQFCGEGTAIFFPSLESLQIQDMASLTKWDRLPGISMNQLRDLKIEDCPNLLSVSSLNHMDALLNLEINRCPRFQSLPELPSSLQSLIIVESDLLQSRCQPEGPDRSFIEVIPYVEIDFEVIRNSNESS